MRYFVLVLCLFSSQLEASRYVLASIFKEGATLGRSTPLRSLRHSSTQLSEEMVSLKTVRCTQCNQDILMPAEYKIGSYLKTSPQKGIKANRFRYFLGGMGTMWWLTYGGVFMEVVGDIISS